jgi:hypothetical protein
MKVLLRRRLPAGRFPLSAFKSNARRCMISKVNGGSRELRLVFDGPPGRDMPTLIEIEDESGCVLKIGHWRARSDGYWELVIPFLGRGSG